MMKKAQAILLLLLTAGLLLLGSCGQNTQKDDRGESENVSPSHVTVTRSASPKFYAGNG